MSDKVLNCCLVLWTGGELLNGKIGELTAKQLGPSEGSGQAIP